MCPALRRCLQWSLSNWRTKVKVVILTLLLATILSQHQQILRERKANIAISHEKRRAAQTISEVIRGLQQNYSRDGVELAGHILSLESLALLLGGGGDEGGETGDEGGEVCGEKYLGNTADWPYQYNSWRLEDCQYGQEMKDLVSLVFRGDTKDQVERVTASLWSYLPGLAVIVRSSVEMDLAGVVSVGEGLSPSEVAGLVSTKYVLWAEDLDYVSDWSDLARGVRLLSGSWLGQTVVAVGGAVRNSSGHWRLDCRQLDLTYYRLELRPGYRHQHQDCMVCSQVGGPLMLRTSHLKLTSPDVSPHLAVLDLVIRRLGLVLSCPDIMFFTQQSTGQELAATTRPQWRHLAARHQFLGVVTNYRKELEVEFECEEVNLHCDVRSQAAAFILPWCCYKSFRHILTNLELVSSQLGIDYQLESGSCLGAVKLANFIPWDIDIDIKFATRDLHHFKPSGRAYSHLTQAGIKLHNFQRDMYYVKDAGMFNMEYGGITVEMMGSLEPLSRELLPAHLVQSPTRVEISPGLWSPVISHPGLYSRGRYGPGYLYHVQSWRHVSSMSSSYQTYSPGAWQPCSQPGHHACLYNYPIEGNTELLSQIYP